MQLRVVRDQPWDVPADALVIPLIGVPRFEGPLAELDRRTGGELAALAAFGEIKTERYSTVLAGAGELKAGRLLAICRRRFGDDHQTGRDPHRIGRGTAPGRSQGDAAGHLAGRPCPAARWRRRCGRRDAGPRRRGRQLRAGHDLPRRPGFGPAATGRADPGCARRGLRRARAGGGARDRHRGGHQPLPPP